MKTEFEGETRAAPRRPALEARSRALRGDRLVDSTKAKTAALAAYSARPSPWMRRGRRGSSPAIGHASGATRRMVAWAAEMAKLPLWLFEESYDAVGDLAETISLHPAAAVDARATCRCGDWVEERLIPLRELGEAEQRAACVVLVRARRHRALRLQQAHHRRLSRRRLRAARDARRSRRRSAWTGGDRAPAHRRLVADARRFGRTRRADASIETDVQPVSLLPRPPAGSDRRSLGPREEWLAEWKWDGIRAQLIRRAGAAPLVARR